MEDGIKTLPVSLRGFPAAAATEGRELMVILLFVGWRFDNKAHGRGINVMDVSDDLGFF